MSIAIVGCGVQAQDRLNALTSVRILRLVTLCDERESMASKVAKDISLVSILSRAESHASLAADAIDHVVNVLVDKPLASTSLEAESILTPAREEHAIQKVCSSLVVAIDDDIESTIGSEMA